MSDSWRPQQDRLERIARHQLSMSPGAVHGRVAEASPVGERRRDEGDSSDELEVIFSFPGAVTTDESPPYYNRVANVDIGTLILASKASTTSSTTVILRVNGTQIASATLAAGQTSTEVLVDDYTLDYGDLVTVQATSVGSGMGSLTAQILLTDG